MDAHEAQVGKKCYRATNGHCLVMAYLEFPRVFEECWQEEAQHSHIRGMLQARSMSALISQDMFHIFSLEKKISH